MQSLRKGLCLYQVDSSVWPLIDLYETEKELVIEIDLPGIEPEAVSVRVYGDVLIIEGMRNDTRGGAEVRYICMERCMRRFRRVITLPVPVNVPAAEARYAHGVVRVQFPKWERKAVEIVVKRSIE